jgi:dihydroorotate dehydrogenase
MGWPYQNFFRPLLFKKDSERAHALILRQLAFAGRRKFTRNLVEKFFAAPELPIELFGLKFPNPVGVAAGMDKNADAVPIWEKLGFGFCELGGVTWHAQTGNPKPRMFRAVADEAVINRMGFNNCGAEILAQKLCDWKNSNRWPKHPVGINLGKSKITPLEKAAEDYANSFRVLRNLADFFVVNVSSPNTPNLRQLQDKAALDEILAGIHEINFSQSREAKVESRTQSASRPILIKIAPDLSLSAIDEILELASARKISGIVATNTTVTRPQTNDSNLQKIYAQAGGLSGKPLRARSTEIIRHIFRQTRGQLPIIGVGGIFSADDAWEKIVAGASLIQIYTGLVFEGPSIAKKIINGLREKMEKKGITKIADAVGLEN